MKSDGRLVAAIVINKEPDAPLSRASGSLLLREKVRVLTASATTVDRLSRRSMGFLPVLNGSR